MRVLSAAVLGSTWSCATSAASPAAAPAPSASEMPAPREGAAPATPAATPDRPEPRAMHSGRPVASPASDTPANDAPSQDAPADAPPPAAVGALLARLGDALLPLGCWSPRGWQTGERCLPSEGLVQVSVQPPLVGESPQRKAWPASIPFLASGSLEPGLALMDEAPGVTSGERPFLGLAVVGGPVVMRFTRAAAKGIETEAGPWCAVTENECGGVDPRAMPKLPEASLEPSERNAAIAVVRRAIRPLAEPLPMRIATTARVAVGGEPRRVVNVEVDTERARGERATALELPHLHFLVMETPEGWRVLGVARDVHFGLGESGELLAAGDLDGDGSDELVLSWAYSEGRSLDLVRWNGGQLVWVGGFTDGS